ncbi:ABC-type uncharacterized transport system, periplasmic component [Beggiatoa alba B18LD]|uniref:ABC-type uncharacterized transport system, periplasmic component n=1 Tax=Beggiatoa alba B18LD TaxID=395493 RepID=I3CDG4_9GAMM|nr:ABC transporter substrate binding protein [Beggiatoa alba]EIJ41657.1 ABC-type uncharacterized transport system, periplasmic component [Beggiatoa alba B18LD]
MLALSIKNIVTIACLCVWVSVSVAAETGVSITGKKVFYVDSYHVGYEWSDGIMQGIQQVLKAEGSEIILQTFYMDTKRGEPDDAAIQAIALRVREEITKFNPDVLIACDDSAVKFLIKPYYKDADLPVVFCGINWDAGIYGLPYKNTTGMIEISLINEIIAHISKYARGSKIGYLAGINNSPKNIEYAKKLFNINYDKVYIVSSVDEWKAYFRRLQDEVDMVIFGNFSNLEGINKDDILKFVLENQKIPTGTDLPWHSEHTLITFAKSPEEQGQWATQTALDILKGKNPSDIPIMHNAKGKLYINLKLGNQLRIAFAPALLKMATIIK